FSPEISTWLEVRVPPKSDRLYRMLWEDSANASTNDWRVVLKDGKPRAELVGRGVYARRQRPAFEPRVREFSEYEALRVDDGWLIGFNEGEWGGALYWFSANGR